MPFTTANLPGPYIMMDILIGGGVLVFYFSLQFWILPKLGIPT